MAILPVAKGLYLCDYHIGNANGKVDLYGLINSFRPANGYPFSGRFCVFAQLANGLGQVPCFVEIRAAANDELIHTTEIMHMSFPDRTTLRQLAVTIESCQFPRRGLYIVQLHCDNQWVCDTLLRMA